MPGYRFFMDSRVLLFFQRFGCGYVLADLRDRHDDGILFSVIGGISRNFAFFKSRAVKAEPVDFPRTFWEEDADDVVTVLIFRNVECDGFQIRFCFVDPSRFPFLFRRKKNEKILSE